MKKRRGASIKWMKMLVCVCLVFMLAGCGKEKEESVDESNTEESVIEQIEETDEKNEEQKQETSEEAVTETGGGDITVEVSDVQKEQYGNDDVTLLTKEVNDVKVMIPGNQDAEDAINAFFYDRNEAWKDTVDLYTEMAENRYAASDEDAWECYELERKYTAKRLDEQMISVVEDMLIYTGGDKRNTVRVAYNFDTWTGERLTLAAAASDLDEIRMESAKYIGELLTEPEYEEILYENYAKYIEDILTDSTWYTDDEGLHIICNEDIIAPQKAGILEFLLPYDEVDVIAEEYIPENQE